MKRERPEGERRGLVLVYTGDGKGKTTAALGLVLRSLGRGFRPRIFQFMKHERAAFGEHRALEKLGVPIEGLGDGFSWRSRDLEKSAELARAGWRQAAAAIASGDWDLVVLDEVTYPLNFGWVPVAEVLDALRARPRHVHVVLTGRDAPRALVAFADTVTEMKKVRHAYDAGVPAAKGMEH
ncbi:cob(I)yrinic acid a,c-diamide adenosyltransferase [Oceanithermus desulfurans]|uniref:Cob(I)alamin adenosyltransferase n=2 Tax=Oceanithermus desulfurans TaxID=227924 RepID=A0A511RJE7_9DEIN|nr:cob(I)yrinic acid a,c-diamide adenosyltransferase [Oceanithermus desulfurans]MBB6029819.1 cob(I)alamin adenosyltransferase [Oceanithermus desulfurans]GEM89780.1 cob(I)alamin adenosyltransferase [Oceanithermus desulfurans NBRC 100063]